MWAKYGKAMAMGVAAVVMAVLVAYREATADRLIDESEWVMVVIAGFSVLTVWGAANIPGFEKAKVFMAAISVVLNFLVGYIVDSLTADEIILLVMHFLGALGVAAAPARSESSPPRLPPSQVRGY